MPIRAISHWPPGWAIARAVRSTDWVLPEDGPPAPRLKSMIPPQVKP